jgi:hypothetical protein
MKFIYFRYCLYKKIKKYPKNIDNKDDDQNANSKKLSKLNEEEKDITLSSFKGKNQTIKTFTLEVTTNVSFELKGIDLSITKQEVLFLSKKREGNNSFSNPNTNRANDEKKLELKEVVVKEEEKEVIKEDEKHKRKLSDNMGKKEYKEEIEEGKHTTREKTIPSI